MSPSTHDRIRAGGSGEQPTPPRPPVSIKGRGDGLRVIIASHDAAAVETSLRHQLAQRAGAFFAAAAVTLELPPGPLDLGLAARVGAIIDEAGMRVATVVGADPSAARQRVEPAVGHPPADIGSSRDAAVVVHRTVRGGQRVAAIGSVVIVGDVNPGAEVLAGGSVVVWGRLRGVVEAGLADGTEIGHEPIVCALDLAPTQLRIGTAIARAPEEPDRVPVPEMARAVDGRIVVEAWR